MSEAGQALDRAFAHRQAVLDRSAATTQAQADALARRQHAGAAAAQPLSATAPVPPRNGESQ